MQWFHFQGVVLHTANNINGPAEHLQLLLKLLSMLKLIIWFYKTIAQDNVPGYVGIMYINCYQAIGGLLYSQTIEDFITPVVINTVLRYVRLYCIIQSNQEHNLYFQYTCPFLMLNGPWYNTRICLPFHGS